MAREIYDYDFPQRFVAGAVGEPGSRNFFLQARDGRRLTTVSLEKAQLSVLAERVDDLLDEVLRRLGEGHDVPASAPNANVDNDPLETPIESEFDVGAMSLAWEMDREIVVIECFSEGLMPDDNGEMEPDGPDATGSVLRVTMSATMARLFAQRASAVIAAGRPPCPFCAGPVEADGHICPRANGYRR